MKPKLTEKENHINTKKIVQTLINQNFDLPEISCKLGLPLGKNSRDKKTVKWYLYCITRAEGAKVTNLKYKDKKKEWGSKAVKTLRKKYGDLSIYFSKCGKISQKKWKHKNINGWQI